MNNTIPYAGRFRECMRTLTRRILCYTFERTAHKMYEHHLYRMDCGGLLAGRHGTRIGASLSHSRPACCQSCPSGYGINIVMNYPHRKLHTDDDAMPKLGTNQRLNAFAPHAQHVHVTRMRPRVADRVSARVQNGLPFNNHK